MRSTSRGLCLPHSPRWHDGRLWVLNSGRGELLSVDPATGRTTVVATLPAYVRGLDFAGRYAFVGLSALRDPSAAAGGLPVQRRFADLLCGVAAVDLRTGTVAGLLRFTAGVTEVFDVRVLPGLRRAMVLNGDQPESRQAFTAPAFSYWVRPAAAGGSDGG